MYGVYFQLQFNTLNISRETDGAEAVAVFRFAKKLF